MVISANGHTIDAGLTFSYPEANLSTLRSFGIMRYRKEDRFESLEYGLMNDVLYYRLHRNWLSRFSTQLLLGVNRWMDIDTTAHDLYDAAIVDFSLGQSIHYSPRNIRTISFGIGIQENVFYIRSLGFQFRVGLLFSLGIHI